ncbi:MAG: CBS domain-containing protein [Candidatus Caldatribacteriota bacterium]|nr:CBS domain-containing protein [Atribacterota bacterium]MDD3030791.1 CBS domain-containing protein [Atribacterota bacterium]MDD3640177.1 CBS domain-containing protein [Atribacterota bacterium]MDD4288283.1 CBS domain-containing protein [Atribacterota bacterium]MDD4764649.1 CBS domain-containing protein [Atribacterota bacterium]
MKVIIGHTSADFDCLASMIAAKKIYSDSVVVFPGAIEENVRKFLSLYGNTLNISSLKHIDMDNISEIIIVDTRQKDRIGPFELLLNKKNIKIRIYDHHPASDNDIVSKNNIIKQVGATTTILLQLIIKKKIPITSLESTIFALGIYEDTGSLSFSTTTKEDIDVLGYLFSIGVNLRTVNKFTNTGLNIQQKKLLNQLISSSQEIYFKGISVVFAKSKTKEYIEGLALVTHKLLEILNSDIIFVLVQMKNRVYVVSRSNRANVNVGDVMKSIGGGGHSQAASAVVRKISLSEVEDKIKKTLNNYIKIETIAKDIMTSPVKSLDVNTTIEEASKIMLRYGHNGFPVMDKNKLVGIITRQEIYKANHHHYENETIDIYMSENIISVNLDTPILEIQELMIRYDVGRVLVLSKDGKLEGIITRTDLIRSLYGEKDINRESYTIYENNNGHYNLRKENIKNLIQKYFPRDILEILYYIGKTGDELGYSVFMVGGIVRDLFLGIPSLDLDIVIEEDALKFARYFSNKLKGKIRSHQKFKTAVVVLPSGLKIDFASARREFYEFPAALPKVEFASIKKDLYRRDFTINAMAIQLNEDKFARLLDFFGGKRDLESKKIRILYSLSFTEDPARIIRAIRFEQRYDFTIEQSTEKFLKKAIKEGLLSKIRKKRLSEEFFILLHEKKPVKVLKRMDELGVLSGIIPKFSLSDDLVKRLEEVEEILIRWHERFPKEIINKSMIYIYYLLKLSDIGIKNITKKIELNSKNIKILENIIDEKELIVSILKDKKTLPSNIYYYLKSINNELLFILFLENYNNETIIKRIKDYLDIYKYTSTYITGNDLIKIGMRPNPIYAKILKLILYLQLNGILKNKDDELDFVKKIIEKGIV